MTGASHPANKRQAGRVRHALTSAGTCCGVHAAINVAGDVSIYRAARRCILVAAAHQVACLLIRGKTGGICLYRQGACKLCMQISRDVICIA